MTLADFTSPALIIPQLRGQDVPSVIQELSQAMQCEKRIPDLLPFYEAVIKREFLVSTNMEAGTAFPHARMPGLQELSFALGRSHEPLRWATRSAHPIRLVFLLAVPAIDATQYLFLISGLVRLAKDAPLMERLLCAPDALQMFELLQQITLRANAGVETPKKAAGIS
jgi:mannitol/fructose-specific phosphotransferase system IIA component (Ntr-type)